MDKVLLFSFYLGYAVVAGCVVDDGVAVMRLPCD